MTTLLLRVTPASLEVAEKNERNERSISVCLISSSTNLLSLAGHEKKVNCSQPKLSQRRRDKKASVVYVFRWIFFFLFYEALHHSIANVQSVSTFKVIFIEGFRKAKEIHLFKYSDA